jgi:hypothetical protein
MPVHDWTKVDAGIFHELHVHWISEIDGRLNDGLLPSDYYAMAEQVTGIGTPDVIALRFSKPTSPSQPSTNGSASEHSSGGVAVAASPPKTRFSDRTDENSIAYKTRSVVIRHVSGDRVVAVIELVSPGNKGSKAEIEALIRKSVEFIRNGVHVTVLDLFPPTTRDPDGLFPLVWSEFKSTDFRLPPGKPLTLASFAAGLIKEAYVETIGAGDTLPDMPLFLLPDLYVQLPLESTYSQAFKRVPRPWKQVLEGGGT